MRRHLKRYVLAAVTVCVTTLTLMDAAHGVIPTAPTLSTVAPADRSVVLTWTASSNTPTDYLIEYSTDEFVNNANTFLDGVSTAVTGTVTGLTNGAVYWFRVKGINSSGTSDASNTLSAIPTSNHTPNDLAVFKACPTGVAPLHGFTDVYASVTSIPVSCIKYYDITKGTTATTYSPSDMVTRWQMALFLTRMAVPAGVTLGDGSDQGFTDIAGKSTDIQTAINQLKQLGITVGTDAAGTLYDPDSNVSREEMALFISRLLKNSATGPGGNEEYVTGSSGAKEIKSLDVDYNYSDIEFVNLTESRTAIISLWNLGAVDDVNATTYRPTDDMTRSAMAKFIAEALNHANARPKGLILQASQYTGDNDFQVTLSATYRNDAFLPNVGALVDTFKYQHTTTTGYARFSSDGSCAQVVVTSVSLTRCYIDATEQATDANGNLTTFAENIPTDTTWDYWAWTAASTTTYDDDVHGTDASKITIDSY